MNRLIKFRIWNTYQKKFENQKEIAITGLGLSLFFDFHESDSAAKSWSHDCWNSTDQGLRVVQRFTGLFDKNGREIYEGDICKWKWTAGEGQIEESTGEVFFENGIFYFGREYFCTADVDFDKLSLEVIGNNFELAA